MPVDATLPISALSHVGIVVKDVDKTIKFLSSIWDIGPTQTIVYSPSKEELIVGEPFTAKIGYINLGTVTLELVQPLKGESLWSDFLKAKGEGIQHIAFVVSNYDEVVSKVQEQGNKMVVGGVFKGKRWCFFDTKPGIVIEISDNF